MRLPSLLLVSTTANALFVAAPRRSTHLRSSADDGSQSLEGLVEGLAMGRPHLLEMLKDIGLKLPDRQKLAKAVARARAAHEESSAREARAALDTPD